jgi:hypothetical protein
MLDLRIVGLRFSSKLRRKHYILSQIKDIKDIGFGFKLCQERAQFVKLNHYL